MLGNQYENEICSAARSLEVVGERWTLLIMRNAIFAGHTRFGDFQRSLGIASNVLARRLEGLVRDGMLERASLSHDASGGRYVLTEKGRDLAPVVVALTQWGDRWAAPEGPPILYRHERCGGKVEVQLVCEQTGRLTDWSAIEAHPGPGMPPERAARIRQRLERLSD